MISLLVVTTTNAYLSISYIFFLSRIASVRWQTVCSMVTGAERTERENEPERPSVIVRPAHCAETLWSVAKACRAELDAVRAANDVGDEIAPGTLLLIPRA